jgi:hypothetical protein
MTSKNILSTTTQVWPQQESPSNSLRILVEGEPSLSLSIIEAARRINAKYDVKFVDGPDARHDLRLMVSVGNGQVYGSGIGACNAGAPQSEQEIRVVRLETKPGNRETRMSPGNLPRTDSVYNASDVHAVTVTRVSNRVHKITSSRYQPKRFFRASRLK